MEVGGRFVEADDRETRVRLAVHGMTCANCARTVEKALRSVPGVESAVVNAAAGAAGVRFDASKADVRALTEAVKGAGYRAVPAGDEDDRSPHQERTGLLLTAVLALPIVLIHQGTAPVPAPEWVILVLATILQFTAGLRFYRGAFFSLRGGAANMDVLVALGITAAWGYSVLVTLVPSAFPGAATFFDMGALLILFIRFGKMLEAGAKGKARSAMTALLRARPETAIRVDESGERVVPVEEIEAGHLFRLRAGDRVPVDGEIAQGGSSIDESTVTGESVPVYRGAGETVTGGTLIVEGSLTVRAVAVGEETFLARMVRMVEEAQLDRAPIQRFADRVSNVFVPVVLAVALLSFFVWFAVVGREFPFALSRAVAVLVVACPCALGLATPTAILVGSGIGLRRGVLFKRGSVLEKIARIGVVLFDKTGTLTRGEPEVTDLVPATGVTEEELLAGAAPGAALSSHPLSRAVVRAAEARGIPVTPATQSMEVAGRGVRFMGGGVPCLLGGEGLLRDGGVDVSFFLSEGERLAGEGKTVIGFAADGALRGIIGLRDEPKPGVADAIARIKANHIRTAMVTGDRARTAGAIARRIGIGEVFAEVPPEGKVEIVRKVREEGRSVAMVGDGINDAPALAAADVGIAIGAGTDVAKETGDVILVHGDPADVAVAVELGRATLRKIKQNLFWALVYNVVMIPFAAGLFSPWGITLPPEIA
ncbi:MAG: heavy metal translocating P-type ATPase, partial [Candidatus Eisenbacteria bacterium]